MKLTKRILVLLLTFSLCVSLVAPVLAFAVEEPTATNEFVEIEPIETVPEEIVPEETVAEEPVVEETVPEEPVVEETVPEEPVVEETVPEEPVVEETVPEEPVVEETVPEEPVVEETVPEEPAAEEEQVLTGIQEMDGVAPADADADAWSAYYNSISRGPRSDAEIENLEEKLSGAAATDVGDDTYYENESNDYYYLADALYDDSARYAHYSKYDLDWYKITVSRRSNIEILLTGESSGLMFSLYESNGDDIITVSTSLGYSGGYYHYAIAGNINAGTYYVCVLDSKYYNHDYLIYYNATPVAPTISKITNVVSGNRVYWNSTGAKSYTVYRKAYNSSTTYLLGTTTATNYLDTSVSSGSHYYYYVASNDDNTSYVSPKSSAKLNTYIGTPDITLRVNRGHGIGLTWDWISGATGYAIYRKPYSGSGSDTWVRVKTIVGGDVTSWDDTSVKENNGSIYRYTVRAIYTDTSKYSSSILSGCRNTGRTMVRLSSVSVSKLSKKSSTSFYVKWTKNSKATGYEVRVMMDSQIVGKDTIGSPKTLERIFTNAQPGVTYKVQVRSYKKVDGVGSFYSAWSTPAYITMPGTYRSASTAALTAVTAE